jgi:hypothetical protein
LYSSPSIIRIIKSRRMRWAGHIARMGETMNTYRILVGKSEGKRPLGRLMRRWEDNIRNLREIGWMEWIGLIWLRIGSCEHGNEPSVKMINETENQRPRPKGAEDPVKEGKFVPALN